MSALLLTQKELNLLKDERQRLQRKKERSYSYENNALSPTEYLSLVNEIESLDKKIANAEIIPQIKLNRKFTVKVDNKLISMIITVNPVDMAGILSCTFNSTVGKALIDKMVGDVIQIETPEGLKKYQVIDIDKN